MKESLPPTAKIAKESKECIQECVSEFISFVVRAPWCPVVLPRPCPVVLRARRADTSRRSPSLDQTSEASERCLDGKRKTLNGEDVLEALTALGFDNYVRARPARLVCPMRVRD